MALGMAVPRSYFCICCLTFEGAGMQRHGLTYCLDCWDQRQRGLPCEHEPNLNGVSAQRKAG